jgi:hypothetical protein
VQDLILGSTYAQYGNRRIFNRIFLPEGIRKVLKKAGRQRNASNKKVLDCRFNGSRFKVHGSEK